jgi:hypothetical protein
MQRLKDTTHLHAHWNKLVKLIHEGGLLHLVWFFFKCAQAPHNPPLMSHPERRRACTGQGREVSAATV